MAVAVVAVAMVTVATVAVSIPANRNMAVIGMGPGNRLRLLG